ncbi:MAG: hypothetical protein WC499_01655 [Patescibacteria group bacterium]|jgi:hypothetical protein
MEILEQELSKEEKKEILQKEVGELISELRFKDAEEMAEGALKVGVEISFQEALQYAFDEKFKNGDLGGAQKIENYAVDKRMPIEIKPEILWQAKESILKEYTYALTVDKNYAEEIEKCAAVYRIKVKDLKK